MAFHVPEPFRQTNGPLGSHSGYGNNGLFIITRKGGKRSLRVICSDLMGWDHVSVSLPDRCPTWEEMCFIKDLFWDAEDCVVQYHVPEADYIDNHPFCLHLFRPQDQDMPRPPSIMVGMKSLNNPIRRQRNE